MTPRQVRALRKYRKWMMTGVRPLSWKPRWRGAVYCSPACGSGCLRSEYNRAVKAADKLAAELGQGWTPRVHENLRWHYSAVSKCGRLKVSPAGRTRAGRVASWFALFGEPGIGGRWSATRKSPRAAVRAVIADGLAELQMITALFRGLVVP